MNGLKHFFEGGGGEGWPCIHACVSLDLGAQFKYFNHYSYVFYYFNQLNKFSIQLQNELQIIFVSFVIGTTN